MTVRIFHGDCRDLLPTLPDKSVHCVVTSPPYWGLRDYGTAKWEGGDADCEHVGRRSVGASTLKTDGRPNPGILDGHKVPGVPYRGICGDCGAIRIDAQIGLESSPDEYVAQMVSVFREVRRVLRDDGTLWLNLGDSYNGYMANQRGTGLETKRQISRKYIEPGADLRTAELKQKDLVGIPWRVAFALQADGWYLRQDIIWSKPNPMPESVRDRCTKSHEYVFLLSKSHRYYYDQDAISEAVADATVSRLAQDVDAQEGSHRVPGKTNGAMKAVGRASGNKTHKGVTEYENSSSEEHRTKAGLLKISDTAYPTRNKRSVWEIATQPFFEAHFATFPPALVEPCILAGCHKGGTVLDPFGGAGTVGLVADRLQRDAILIELNPAYAEMATRRVTNDAPMFAQVVG